MNIGLIGHGNFGKLCVKELSAYADIKFFDSDSQEGESSIQDVIEPSKFIILAVPMRSLKSVCEDMKPHLDSSKVLIDICSLKMFSRDVLEKVLPDIPKVHTHPLFGPQSAKDGVAGQRIAICPSDGPWKEVAEFCSSTLKLNVIETTAEDHDRQMAVSQALTHFIGRIAERMKLDRGTMPTKSFEDLMKIVDLVKGSSHDLFVDMQTLNPFATKVRSDFVKEAFRLNLDVDEDRF